MKYIDWHQRSQKSQQVQDAAESRGGISTRPPPPPFVDVDEKGAMGRAIEQLGQYLPTMQFKIIQLLPRARRPIITLQDRTGALGECDVSVNNLLPHYNSQLLRAYSLLDDRVRPLALLVKAWAKSHKVCGAQEGNLSSYAWTIMVIYFLQLILTDSLPSLQKLAKKEELVEDRDYWGHSRQFDASFLSAEDYMRSRGGVGDGAKNNKQWSIAQLLFGFFRFYNREYRWGGEVVSIRQPDRHHCGPYLRIAGATSLGEGAIHVEDPIEIRDLNIVLRKDRLAQLKAELKHADEQLLYGFSLDDLLTFHGSRPCEVPVVPRRKKTPFKFKRRMHQR